MTNLLPQGIAVDGFGFVNKAILASPLRANEISDLVLKVLPAEGRRDAPGLMR